MISQEELVYARDQWVEANKRIEFVLERIDDDDHTDRDPTRYEVYSNLPNVISDCQISIEMLTKAIFKLVGINPPEVHDISFDDERTKGMLNRIPEDFEGKDKIPRVIFLNQFWHQFYTKAKYGVPEQNIRAVSLFRPRDAIRAVEDAEYCKSVCSKFMTHVEDSDEDLDIFGDLPSEAITDLEGR